MKQKVKFSAYSLIVTAVVLILCVVGIFSLIGNAEKLTLFCIIMGGATIVGTRSTATNGAMTLVNPIRFSYHRPPIP